MQDSRASFFINHFEKLKGERVTYDSHCQEIAEYMLPYRADFYVERTMGEKRLERIFDSTAIYSIENLASGIWSSGTNSSDPWFNLSTIDEDLNKYRPVQDWLWDSSKRMLTAFSSNGSQFYTQAYSLYKDIVAFGTGVFYIEEEVAKNRLFYAHRHLAECYLDQNNYGVIDTVYRRFKFTARQAMQHFGDDVSEPIKRAADKEPNKEFEFVHVVMPREDFSSSKTLSKNGKPFGSYYVECEGKKILREGGYDSFPYMTPRWSIGSRKIYGDSPAMMALPDVKALNAMVRTNMVAAQKIADPPLLAKDEMAMRGVRTTPGAIIYGGIDPNTGAPAYQPLVTGASINLGLELEEQRRQSIREAFYFSLMLMAQKPNMTATEVLARQEEKIRLMGPHLGRIQAEFLEPVIDRQFDLMMRAGAFLPPPEELQGVELKVQYTSPLAKAQRASEVNAVMRTLEGIGMLGQVKPEVYDVIDADKTAEIIGNGNGAPSKIFRDPEMVQEQRQARAQAEQMQQMAAAAQPVAGAAKQGAEAAQIMGEMQAEQ